MAPILVQMVKSANTTGLLDSESDELRAFAEGVKKRLHRTVSTDDKVNELYEYVKSMRHELTSLDNDDLLLYCDESLHSACDRWATLERDLYDVKSGTFNVSKVPDVYDSIKYDIQHNSQVLTFPSIMNNLYRTAKSLADIVIPQEYGMSETEKLNISHGYCVPLLKKIRDDFDRTAWDLDDATTPQLSRRHSTGYGVCNYERSVRTRLYFTSESHIHSLFNIFRHGGLCDQQEQWVNALEYLSNVNELNYLAQIVIMLYEDTAKPVDDPKRSHVEIHFSPGATLSSSSTLETMNSTGSKVTHLALFVCF